MHCFDIFILATLALKLLNSLFNTLREFKYNVQKLLNVMNVRNLKQNAKFAKSCKQTYLQNPGLN